MINKLLTIAANTFTETLRQPIYAVILCFALLMFLLSPSITMYSLDEDTKFLREIGLSTLFLTGLFIAIFAASGAVTEEIETKTITTILSKPISRPTFIIGKFLGVSAAVSLAHYICTLAYLMVVRHGVLEAATDTHDWTVIVAASVTVTAVLFITAFLNYSYDWNFPATAIVLTSIFATFAMSFLLCIDKGWTFNPANNQMSLFDVNASLLLLLAILVLVSLAIMFSTRFNIVLTLIFCVGAFLFGLISEYLYMKIITSYPHGQIWGHVVRVFIPNLQVFWISDAIYEGSVIPASYILTSILYAGLYISGILFMAVALFQKRQVG
ncbi:MAG: ABC transporter permease subunit [Planctomycetes bacterium]|nr:ABC transporter permease subunit [Planctomycetota bacterium]